jgi:hypothetical protein
MGGGGGGYLPAVLLHLNLINYFPKNIQGIIQRLFSYALERFYSQLGELAKTTIKFMTQGDAPTFQEHVTRDMWK